MTMMPEEIIHPTPKNYIRSRAPHPSDTKNLGKPFPKDDHPIPVESLQRDAVHHCSSQIFLSFNHSYFLIFNLESSSTIGSWFISTEKGLPPLAIMSLLSLDFCRRKMPRSFKYSSSCPAVKNITENLHRYSSKDLVSRPLILLVVLF